MSQKLSPQQKVVISHLLTGQPLTPVSALVNFGVGRLASRIDELKNHKGYGCIEMTMKKVGKKKYGSYSLPRCKFCRDNAREDGVLA
jgi:hypothetical protein